MIPKDNFWKQRRTLNSFCGKVAKFRSTLHFMEEFNSNTNILMLMQPTFEEKNTEGLHSTLTMTKDFLSMVSAHRENVSFQFSFYPR